MRRTLLTGLLIALAGSAAGEGLPARAPFGEFRGGLFAPRPVPRPPVIAVPKAAAEPVVPPLPYRVAGRVTHDGVVKVVLLKGDVVMLMEEGEAREAGYRVESIAAGEITPASVRSRKSERRRAAYASQ